MRLSYRLPWTWLWLLAIAVPSQARVLDFYRDFHAIPDDDSPDACQNNKQLLMSALRHNASGADLVFAANQTFYFYPGISASHVDNTRLVIDGTLKFQRPRHWEQRVLDENQGASLKERWDDLPPCFFIEHSKNFTITSTTRGVIDGQGSQWWGIPFIGYLEIVEQRPRLVRFNLTEDLLIENIILQDSPYHTLYLTAVNRAEVRNISIVNRRTKRDGHSWIDLSAFNTDGIDVCGKNIHVHDVDIWNQDDCITITDNFWHDHVTENITFERVNASGVGFAIGSIGGSTVRNITFRDSYIHKSVKGLYLKFHIPGPYWNDRNMTGLIENILFENIAMEGTSTWPIWIGPAQQADARNPCYPNPCSLCWPMTPTAQCNVVESSQYRNITLRNIQINNPGWSPGIILSNEVNAIDGILFDNVRVTKGPRIDIPEDLTITFPGLKQPVHDAYVPGRLGEDVEEDVIPEPEDFLLKGDLRENRALIITLAVLISVLTVVFLVALFFFLRPTPAAPASMVATASVTRNRRVRFDASVLAKAEGDEASSAPLLLQPPTTRVSTSFIVTHHHLTTLVVIISGMTFFMVRLLMVSFGPSWEKTDRYYKCQGVVGGVARGNTWPVPDCFRHEQTMREMLASPFTEYIGTTLMTGTALALCLYWALFCSRTKHEDRSATYDLLVVDEEEESSSFAA